jgi:hypothetical protein
VHETAADLAALQALLDASYAAAGPHLRSIHTPVARRDASAFVAVYDGMQVLVVATVTADGRPVTGPVDSFLYRGQLPFGTAATAVRARHLRRRPNVSATHVRGEGVVVTAHGRVRELDLGGADAGFAELTRAHDGQGWDEWPDAPVAWRSKRSGCSPSDLTVLTAG